MPGLWTTGSTATIEEDRGSASEGGSVRIALQPVVGSLSAPILDGSDAMPDESDLGDLGESSELATPSDDLPWSGLWAPSVRTAPVAVSLAIGAAIGLVTGDAPFGAWSGLFAWFVSGLRSASDTVSFSFGEGFLGYRPDPRWPLGVQEDDDVRWDWTVPREAPDDESDTPAENVTISVG
jgi:hypothetical protein